MPDPFEIDSFADQMARVLRLYPPLPAWLERRLLRANERVTWVRGPRWNPWWERYVTHPAMFVVALALGAVCLGAGRLGAVQVFNSLAVIVYLKLSGSRLSNRPCAVSP